jgi:tRNA threonylcarbamoyladenosine biosynthesis protein TsaE
MSDMKKMISHSEKETMDFGKKLGQACRGGEVFALFGELGAGKTKLVQGLAKGLGVQGRVNSPTFNILKIYKMKRQVGHIKQSGRPKFFCHIDAYRLKSGKDLAALGVKEFFNSPETVTAIEWAERVKGILPKGVKIIRIKSIRHGRIKDKGGIGATKDIRELSF